MSGKGGQGRLFRARAWIADDPDPTTRAELQRVLDDVVAGGPDDELADRMAGMLRFGTAGLRGPVRAGPAGMNVAVVRRATAGLAAWLARDGARGTVVVGRDARHGSEAFAAATADVLAGAGFTVRTLPSPLPTPVLAFAVRELGAVAGVQITASHNPPADNGYKVYLADGAQLAPPSDTEIEAAITAAPPAVSVPVGGDVSEVDVAVVDVVGSYLDRVARLPRGTARTLRIALTPMHGVGGATAVHALHRAGFTDVHVVASQAAPDPDFPTVAFPNPEEPGATDALLALAAEVGADLAVALDPDADRCALGVPTESGWRMLTGDETGVLLGDHLLRTGSHDDPLVATTVVSSSMLRSVAQAHGARFAETLTGFKWIVRGGPGLMFGYEEALGYCVDPGAVNDKDGIAAATVACDLAATLRADGRGLLDRLDDLSAQHGVHLTRGISVRMEPGPRDAAVARLRDAPPDGWAVTRPAPDVLVLRRDGERLVIRPSGTEPKLKAYLEVVEHGDRARAQARLDALDGETRTLLGVRVSRLLVVHHTPSPATAELLDAVLVGANDPGITGVEVVRRAALAATATDLLAADAVVLGTPANIGYMSGALKHFFDTVYYVCADDTRGLPFGLYVHGNLGVEGAVRSVEAVTTGLGWAQTAAHVLVTGAPGPSDLDACTELGGILAATIEPATG